MNISFVDLSDAALIAEVMSLAQDERRATAELVASLAELDSRKLYLAEGCSSLFAYCTQVLRLSEYAAYARITAARAVQQFPVLVDPLTTGEITLTTVSLVSAHLPPDNCRELLASVAGKTKREVQQVVAALHPQPAVASVVRKLPAPSPQPTLVESPSAAASVSQDRVRDGALSAAPLIVPRPKPAVVAPLSPDLYKVQFTISREAHDKLRRVQDLMRHTNPKGDPAVIFERALTLLLADLEKRRLGVTDRPRAARPTGPGSRHISAGVKRAVWARDGGRCAFNGTNGRCAETGFLEYHHVVPYADGGEATVANIELRCRAHNAYESEGLFGPWASAAVRESAPKYAGRTLSGPSSGRWMGEGSAPMSDSPRPLPGEIAPDETGETGDQELLCERRKLS